MESALIALLALLALLALIAGFAAGCAVAPLRRWHAARARARARRQRKCVRRPRPGPMTPALRAIVREECAAAGVHLAELIGPHKRRCKRVTAVRWAVLGRAWRELRPGKPRAYTLASISAALNIDHSSAHYALEKMGARGGEGESAPASEATPQGRLAARAVARNRPSASAGGR